MPHKQERKCPKCGVVYKHWVEDVVIDGKKQTVRRLKCSCGTKTEVLFQLGE